MIEIEDKLFEGLQALSDSAFPKRCSTCGREYNSPEEFFRHSTAPGARSGLKSSWDDDDRPVVELFRNCACGSTLMDVFSDRRDASDRGIKRRKIFGELLEKLIARGLDGKEARAELTNVMRGRASPKLEAMGLQLVTRAGDRRSP